MRSGWRCSIAQVRRPRGLLIADYRETQLEGEQKTPSFAVDTGGIAPAIYPRRASGEPAQ